MLLKGPAETEEDCRESRRVPFFLEVDDFDQRYAELCAAGVHFIEAPRVEASGKVVVFTDLYGNQWDLVERFVDR